MSSGRSSSPRLRLRRAGGRSRSHPWIYAGEIAGLEGAPEPGDAVTVLDAAGALVGRGFYNPRPSLACRILTRRDEPIDPAWFAGRIGEAAAYRQALELPGQAHRLVWSEGDGLPGLVVDRYAEVVVIQCLTLGMSRALPWIAAGLRGAVGEVPIYLADEPGAARLEGFEPRRGWLDRDGPETVTVTEGPSRFTARVGTGQKTGLYLDQAENRLRVARWAAGRTVLDAFAYTGAFAVQALAAGAAQAVCVESSPVAVAGATADLELNGFGGRAELPGAAIFLEEMNQPGGAERDFLRGAVGNRCGQDQGGLAAGSSARARASAWWSSIPRRSPAARARSRRRRAATRRSTCGRCACSSGAGSSPRFPAPITSPRPGSRRCAGRPRRTRGRRCARSNRSARAAIIRSC